MAKDDDIFPTDVFDEQRFLTLEELSRLCNVQTTLIVELVEEGVLEPADTRAAQWSFSGTCIRRVKVAGRLRRDLDVNLAGVALVLELLEELEQLRRLR